MEKNEHSYEKSLLGSKHELGGLVVFAVCGSSCSIEEGGYIMNISIKGMMWWWNRWKWWWWKMRRYVESVEVVVVEDEEVCGLRKHARFEFK